MKYYSIQGTLCRQESYQQYNANRFDNHVIHEYKARSQSECASTCLSLPEKCVSFNWKDVDKTCQLNNAGKVDFPSDVTSNADWKHYGVDDSYREVCKETRE